MAHTFIPVNSLRSVIKDRWLGPGMLMVERDTYFEKIECDKQMKCKTIYADFSPLAISQNKHALERSKNGMSVRRGAIAQMIFEAKLIIIYIVEFQNAEGV